MMSKTSQNPFGARSTFDSGNGAATMFRLDALEKDGLGTISRFAFSVKVLLEAVLRNCDGRLVTEEDVSALAGWRARRPGDRELPFQPARVVLQAFTGVPAVVDLAALRSAVKRLGGNPERINPAVPVDLVIDHSVQVDVFGTAMAYQKNAEIEFQRNRERYEFLRWGQEVFDNFRVVPPATGIVHQVNLEYLAKVVACREQGGELRVFPDTLVGTDSHTTMINGLGVLGWGVGGIEAEAAMLGQPMFLPSPHVLGVRVRGAPPAGTTATDLVLTLTQTLRAHGVVGSFVEFFGDGCSTLELADRATLSNMCPEYGATAAFWPVSDETLRYLRSTGRGDRVELVPCCCKERGVLRRDATPGPVFAEVLDLDLSAI